MKLRSKLPPVISHEGFTVTPYHPTIQQPPRSKPITQRRKQNKIAPKLQPTPSTPVSGNALRPLAASTPTIYRNFLSSEPGIYIYSEMSMDSKFDNYERKTELYRWNIKKVFYAQAVKQGCQLYICFFCIGIVKDMHFNEQKTNWDYTLLIKFEILNEFWCFQLILYIYIFFVKI